MKTNKLLSVGMAAALALANTVVPAGAQGESPYAVFDLTASANLVGFNVPGAATEGISPADYSGGENTLKVFNKTAFDSCKNSEGNLVAQNGYPFKVSTELEKKNLVSVGGYNRPTEAVIDIPDGKYDAIAFTAAAMNVSYINKFDIKVYYADGTYKQETEYKKINGEVYYSNETIEGLLSPSDETIKPAVSIIESFRYNWFYDPSTDEAKEQSKLTAMYLSDIKLGENGTIASPETLTAKINESYILPVYEIPLNPLKKAVRVEIAGCDQYTSTTILAMTGLRATAEKMVEALDAAEQIDGTNYYNYAPTVAEIEDKLSAGETLSETALAKFNAVKAKIDSFAGRYTVFDLSDSANAVTFHNAEGTDASTLAAADYPKNDGNIVVYNKDSFDTFKKPDGNIYADNGYPFGISTDTAKKNTVVVGGYEGAPNNVRVDVKGGRYDKIAFTCYALNSAYITNFYFTLHYLDGSYEKDTTYNSVYGEVYSGDSAQVERLYTPQAENIRPAVSVISDFGHIDYNNPKETVLRFNISDNKLEYNKNNMYLPVYEITADPTKTLSYIEVSGCGASTSVGIFAMTGINATAQNMKGYAVEKLKEEITAENIYEYIKYIDMLEAYGAEKLTDDERALYEEAKALRDAAVGGYEIFDISDSYTLGSVVYEEPGKANNASANPDNYLTVRTASGYAVNSILNKTYFDKALEQNSGYILADVPFAVRTTGAVLTGGKRAGEVQTITVNSEKALSSIHFLADVSFKGARGTLGQIVYADGTTADYTAYVNDDVESKTGALFIYDIPAAEFEANDLKVTPDSGETKHGKLYSYSLDVDPGKLIKSISVYANDSWSGAQILALTGTAARELTDIERLDAYNGRAQSLTKTEIDDAYALFRKLAKAGEISEIHYADLLERKAESGVVTINDAEVTGNKFTAEVNIAKLGETYSFAVILAEYDGNKLTDVKSFDFADAEFTKSGTPIEYTFAEGTEGKTIKCFALDSLKTLKPMSEITVK